MSCPNDLCRNTSCNAPVHVSVLGKHYYCMNHMHCGTSGPPCDGCLKTVQDIDNSIKNTGMDNCKLLD